ncbi:hypothetical protein Tco_0874408 [Tanacetum coccineum]|uniref:Uncharacterized protein n=1 Tax=Tanacetum coccineum TaxID=301880 RepID=A0ABQ5BPI1_9ASTR
MQQSITRFDNVIGDLLEGPSLKFNYKMKALFYYFDAFLSSVEPMSYKQALTESSWIEVMQEELNEFERDMSGRSKTLRNLLLPISHLVDPRESNHVYKAYERHLRFVKQATGLDRRKRTYYDAGTMWVAKIPECTSGSSAAISNVSVGASERTEFDEDENHNLNQNDDDIEDEYKDEYVREREMAEMIDVSQDDVINEDTMILAGNEIISMMNVDVLHEEPSNQTPSLLTILVTARKIYSDWDQQDDKANSDEDGNFDANDNERTDSDDDDENPSFTLKDYDEEEHDEEYESDDDYENMFEEEDDDDLYKDVDVRSLGTKHEKERQGDEEMTDADQNVSQELPYEQVVEDAHVILTAS